MSNSNHTSRKTYHFGPCDLDQGSSWGEEGAKGKNDPWSKVEGSNWLFCLKNTL